jgi:hypothetical protein
MDVSFVERGSGKTLVLPGAESSVALRTDGSQNKYYFVTLGE